MQSRLDQLEDGSLPYVLVGCALLPAQPLLLPGSFNPLHQGHARLLRAAEKITARDGLFELSVLNVDKPPLSRVEIERRLLQWQGVYSVALTCAPTFLEKAKLFPEAWFAVGFDTVVRLLSPAYHSDVPAMLEAFRQLGTRFIVAGRMYAGAYQSLDQLEIPSTFADLFIPIPESLFREDISSTEVRRKLEP